VENVNEDLFQTKVTNYLEKIASSLTTIADSMKVIVTMQNHHELLSEVRADIDFMHDLLYIARHGELIRSKLGLEKLIEDRLMSLLDIEYVDGNYAGKQKVQKV
jgi:hypothetical protein